MKIIEISRSFSKKIQERQFEPYEIFASYKAEVDETEDLEKCSKELFRRAVNDVGISYAEKEWERWTQPKKVVTETVKRELAERDNFLKDLK